MLPNKERQLKLIIAGVVLCMASVFLFSRLGHHGLWDDEAICTLFARSLWHNGDTLAIQGHNIMAFNYGNELVDMRMRYIPPLRFYFAAPFAAWSQGSTLIVRFPFAFCIEKFIILSIEFLCDCLYLTLTSSSLSFSMNFVTTGP